jgi:peptidoglycan hydrolase-like protein with peptidoglycan-binding domain
MSGKPDGKFGNGTEAAVKSFQKTNGLTADGIAGETTQKLLYSGKAKAATAKATTMPTTAPKATATPTPTASQSKDGIAVAGTLR